MSQYVPGSYETQFESQSGDEDNLYNVERILAEKGRKYLVQWEGIDPSTGEKWAPDWVAKTDCTDDLIADWKREKARAKRLAGGTSLRSSSSVSVSGSVDGRVPTFRSTSKKGKDSKKAGPSTLSRSKSPVSKAGDTRRQSRVYVDVPAPRVTKRRRESEITSEPLSPVKRLKLGGPASPLPVSPFDKDDGGLGSIVKKKRPGPVTYKRRKPAVVKTPSFPSLTGPFAGQSHGAGSSRAAGEPTNVMEVSSEEDARAPTKNKENTDTETESEEEDDPVPKEQTTRAQGSPVKSKSETAFGPRTRNTTRTLTTLGPTTDPAPLSLRSAANPFARPHPTSSARTRPPPPRDPRVQREIERKINQGMPEDINAQGMWPRVVLRDIGASRKSDSQRSRASTSKASTSAGSRRVSKATSEVAQPGPSTTTVPTSPQVPPAPADDSAPSLVRRPSLIKPTADPSGKPSPAKSVSFHVDGVDDLNEYQAEEPIPHTTTGEDDYDGASERVLSSVESENGILSQVSQRPSQLRHSSPPRIERSPVSHPKPRSVSLSQTQSQSRSNSSKSTLISDSQQSESPALPDADAEAVRTEAPKQASPTLAPRRAPVKPRPSELFRAGKGILIKRTSTSKAPPARVSGSGISGRNNYGDSASESDSSSAAARPKFPPPGTGASVDTRPQRQTAPSEPRPQDDESSSTSSDEGGMRPEEKVESEAEESEVEQTEAVQEEELDEDEQRGQQDEIESEQPDSEDQGQDATETVGGVDVPSSPSLGGGDTRLRSVSPLQESITAYPDDSAAPSTATTQAREDDTMTEEGGQNAANDSYGPNDGDISMAHVMEVDELLSSNVSQQSVEQDHDDELAGNEPGQVSNESIIDLVDSTPTNVGTQESPAKNFKVTSPPTGRVLAPDTQPTAGPAGVLQTARNIMSTLVPGILDASQSQSQSQSQPPLPDSQDPPFIPPNLSAEIISDIISQPAAPDIQSQPAPDSLPASQQQPQEKTHSSIEEPGSSWSLPPLAQLPPPTDTISTFTPTNPSVKEVPTIPTSSSERILPSSLAVAINGHTGSSSLPSNVVVSPTANRNDLSPQSNRDRVDAPTSSAPPRSGILGPVPDMSVDVFRRQASPGSDIGQFSSPPKPTFLQGSPDSSDRVSIRPYQRPESRDVSPRFGWGTGPRDSRGTLPSSQPFDRSVIEERDNKIQEQASRIEELLAQVASLEEAQKASETKAATWVNMATELTTTLDKERADHAREIQVQSTTIQDLQTRIQGVRSQFEISESQREFALEQYTIASTEAKRLSDENKKLDGKVQKLEKQLKDGLRQWQVGFESNVERHQQDVQRLEGQLAAEREMYARAKAPELCRRAAEWHELKARIKELEEECADAERREQGLLEREREIRRKELEIAEREQALEQAPRPSQSQVGQPEQGLSQDDLQTETMLSDRSAVLASLDGEAGEEMVYMCSFREESGKICGKVFDTMGLLLGHVLDAAGHNMEGECSCPQTN